MCTIVRCRGSPPCGASEDEDSVDMVIIGAGAGGGVLAQRLSRAGWRVVVLECGPFWDPDKDWVSDEAGAQPLYWNQKRIIGGTDPIELGKNNSGRGVGGSMIHYAGYTPRFHPSDFETYSRDGVGADWPISYEDVRPHYELVEAELPVSGQDWPWGYPHKYPFAAHPVSGAGITSDRRRAALWARNASWAGGDYERHVRQPAALHLSGVLPAGMQGERQSEPAGHAHPRCD